MRRVRARWFLGLGLLVSGAAISCGSGDSAGLFTASTGGAGTLSGSSGTSNQAGAHNGVGGDEGGGAFNQAGGGGSDQSSGAPGAGMTSTEGGGSGSPAGGTMGMAGKGGSTGKAGNSGGGAGGKGGGMSGGGAAGAGAGGATAGAGGTPGGGAGAGGGGTSGGGGAGPVPCSDNAGCSDTQYCAKADCSLVANGTCTARPIDCTGTAETALCGCDGFTYHDACLMHLNGQNSLAAGVCPKIGISSASTVTCSAASDAACTVKAGGACGFRADTPCPGALPAKGICWVLPSTCPTSGGTAKAAEVCNVGQPGPPSFCVSECTAVKAQVRYALPGTCG